MSKYRGYIIHDGLLMGQAVNGYILSDEAKEATRKLLPGVTVLKELVNRIENSQPDNVLGTVLLLGDKLVIRLMDPLDEKVAATLRPALSLVAESEGGDGVEVVTKVHGVVAVALVAKEDGDLGYLEPYAELN